MIQEKIHFRQARDFGETFNVSIKFLRKNFKLFFQSILFIAGPFVLLTAITGAFYQADSIGMMSTSRLFSRGADPFAAYGWSFVLFLIASMISSLALIGTTFSFMSTYENLGPGNFTVNDVAKTLLKNAGRLIGGFFLLLVIIIVFVVVFALVIGLLASITPALGIFVGFLAVIGLLIIAPPFMWQFSTFYLVAIHEDVGPQTALSRVREVMRGEFWWTWLLTFAALLAVGVAGFVFTAPQLIYQMVLMVSNMQDGDGGTSMSFIVVATVCTFCSTLLYSCLYVICGFHYFSLAEKKDGTGLMDRINEIGNTPVQNVDQQY